MAGVNSAKMQRYTHFIICYTQVLNRERENPIFKTQYFNIDHYFIEKYWPFDAGFDTCLAELAMAQPLLRDPRSLVCDKGYPADQGKYKIKNFNF